MDDPRAVLAREPMSRAQVVAIALCVLLNGLDGFDVLSISFASPGIAKEWGMERAALGVVLSMELIGMAIGSIVLGNVADRIGRRPAVLACLVMMTIGMFLTATAPGVIILSLYRLLTGLGIGGMLAATNAVVAEFANARRRSLCVALMAAGYPAGAVIGGAIVSRLLVGGDWRVVFAFGASATMLLIPLVWLFLPETIGYLIQKRPTGALARVNATLRRMGRAPVAALPDMMPGPSGAAPGQLFGPGLARTTLLLTIAYFAHIMTFYFILKWIPKIVVDMGVDPSGAGAVLVWANVGGAGGALVLSLLTQRIDVRRLVIGALAVSAGMVILFGQGQADLARLALVAGMTGFFTNAAVVGMYAILAESFPTAVRAGGTGVVIGVGRGGAALGPIVAGVLFQGGAGLAQVAIVMALGSVAAAAALCLLGATATRNESVSARSM